MAEIKRETIEVLTCLACGIKSTKRPVAVVATTIAAEYPPCDLYEDGHTVSKIIQASLCGKCIERLEHFLEKGTTSKKRKPKEESMNQAAAVA